MIKLNDFVVLKTPINDLATNSVGIVRQVNESSVIVFFIGKRVELKLSINEVEFLDVAKTGKSFEYKICNICHILKKDLEDFDINQTDAQGRKTTRPSCKSCRIEIDGMPLNNEAKKQLDTSKPSHFFICPICEKGSIPGITANFVKDHDHLTGKAREWICDSCNTGLGRFKDDINLLKRAIAYLEKHSTHKNN
ncbi:MAG: endonuclease VII domain-containing protein [Microscillaceae bacterium]|jgi:hypothetical protein|nr:endonuclease VII domain-containing protein [Microscillaceae bacterium]